MEVVVVVVVVVVEFETRVALLMDVLGVAAEALLGGKDEIGVEGKGGLGCLGVVPVE